MQYSIIIPYRNREEHLSKLLPRLQELFSEADYEIIITEQDDLDKFQKNSLYNLAAVRAQGDLLIFHDVDYYPAANVNYYTSALVPYYPVGKVVFLDAADSPKPVGDIPQGYQNFHNTVGDHSGGVFVLSKELFFKAGGLNPYYKGWGKEDDDTRDRLRLLGYTWQRNKEGLFYALDHSDNHPSMDDPDFIQNHVLLAKIRQNLHLGYKNVSAEVEKFKAGDNIKWLKIKNFKYESIN
jgi:predicted glycosyltransferase involved in capsule biosynthesis